MEKKQVTGFGDDWRGYFVNIDEPLNICYDASVKQLSENIRKQYPNTVIVEIPLTEENENEYLPKSKSDWIFEISENLSCGRFDVRMIGIIVGPNWGKIALCCDIKEKKVLKLINTLFKGIAVKRLRHLFILDDNFAYYNTVLTPPHYEDNCIKNRAVCDRLTENGEAFKESREIEFLCCFSDTQHIQQIVDKFADDFMEYGFNEIDRRKEDNGAYWLEFTLRGIPSLLWIHEITCWIIYSLVGTDGYFDGWGCLVIKDEEA